MGLTGQTHRLRHGKAWGRAGGGGSMREAVPTSQNVSLPRALCEALPPDPAGPCCHLWTEPDPPVCPFDISYTRFALSKEGEQDLPQRHARRPQEGPSQADFPETSWHRPRGPVQMLRWTRPLLRVVGAQ